MGARGLHRIESGMVVYDRHNRRLGTVARFYDLKDDLQPAGHVPASEERGYLEVAADLLTALRVGLGPGRRLFVPLAAVRDVTAGRVFLAPDRAELNRTDWHTRPAALGPHTERRAAPAPEEATPRPSGR